MEFQFHMQPAINSGKVISHKRQDFHECVIDIDESFSRFLIYRSRDTCCIRNIVQYP